MLDGMPDAKKVAGHESSHRIRVFMSRYFDFRYSSLLIIVLVASCRTTQPIQHERNEVHLSTTLGEIVVEIYSSAAPITAANFLRYIDENRFDSASFYRTVTMDNQPNNDIRIEVIQGGLSRFGSKRLEAIPHETTADTGLLHTDGALSMARSEPGTASSEFFICIGDQPSLDFGGMRNPDGQGFSVFGRVTSGMDVVRAIHNSAREEQRLTPAIAIRSFARVK